METKVPVTIEPGRIAEDAALLRKYADSGEEAEFQKLVDRYVGLVFGVALRRTRNRCQAEEISQNVFAALARKAGRLNLHTSLASWLHRVTILESIDHHRRDRSYQDKLRRYQDNAELDQSGSSVWKDALPLLDEAIADLTPADRDIIFQRFFEKKRFRDIASQLNKSEPAAQKQVERALQKLSSHLRRKGVALPLGLLVAHLGTHLAQAAPTGLSLTLAKGALTGTSITQFKQFLLNSLQAMSQSSLKSKWTATLLVATAIPLAWQWQQNNELRHALLDAQAVIAQSKSVTQPVNASPANGNPLPGARQLQKDSRNQDHALAAAAGDNLQPQDTLRQWRAALFEPDPVLRLRQLSALLENLDPVTAPAIADLFDQAKAKGTTFGQEYRLFLREWGKLDGPSVMAHLAGKAGKHRASPESLAALAGWASLAPQAARAWMESADLGAAREDMILGLLDGWSMVDFQGAAAYAESRPRSTARNKFRALLLKRSLAVGGISAAQTWFHRIPDNEHNQLYKQHAFDEVIQAMLYRDPSAAAHWIAQHDGQNYLKGEALKNTARSMSKINPRDTIHWLDSLVATPPEERHNHLGSVVQSWTDQDAAAAGQWLDQNRHHPAYDAMASGYVTGIQKDHPETALAWAETIQDESLRKARSLDIARSLKKTHPDFTRDWWVAAGGREDWFDEATDEKWHLAQDLYYANSVFLGETLRGFDFHVPRDQPLQVTPEGDVQVHHSQSLSADSCVQCHRTPQESYDAFLWENETPDQNGYFLDVFGLPPSAATPEQKEMFEYWISRPNLLSQGR